MKVTLATALFHLISYNITYEKDRDMKTLQNGLESWQMISWDKR